MSTTINPGNLPQAEAAPTSLPLTKEALPISSQKARSPLEGQWRRWAFFKGKRRMIWAVTVGAIVVTGLVWFVWHWVLKPKGGPADITAIATRADLPITVTESGELESAHTVETRCEVEGWQNKLIDILPEGTRVKKGQVVAHFDADQLHRQFLDQEAKYKTAVGQAKAAKSEWEVQRNKAEGDIADAELAWKLAVLDRDKYIQGEYIAEVNEKKGDIELAKKDLEEAQEDLEHFRTFVKKGFGVPEQLRPKELNVAQKKYALTSKQAKLDLLERFTKVRQMTELESKAAEAERKYKRAKASGAAAVEKAKSAYEAAEATAAVEKTNRDRLQRQIEHCTVKAPEEGLLVYSQDRYWDPSSKVQPGAMIHNQQILFTLPDLTKMQVKVRIHESVIEKVKKGQKAEIQVESYPNKILHGTVKSVGTLADTTGFYIDRNVKQYVTIISIDDLPLEASLKPGMTAQVKILCKNLPNVLIVPVQAVTEREGKHYAYVLARNGNPERREVSVGESNDKFVEITSGLQEGEPVALNARARSAAEAKASENNAMPKRTPEEKQGSKVQKRPLRPR